LAIEPFIFLEITPDAFSKEKLLTRNQTGSHMGCSEHSGQLLLSLQIPNLLGGVYAEFAETEISDDFISWGVFLRRRGLHYRASFFERG
jgi:hypothetical protein